MPGTVTEAPQKRYLILAEEFSHDPHYGKTLRGVYRVELYLDQLGSLLDGKPWIVSNPIFIR